MNSIDFATSLTATLLRTGAGTYARPACRQPQQLLQLYEFEGCPHCRLVREVITELDLDVQVFPCPKGGKRYRSGVIERGGKAQFPYLIDPDESVAMYESADIIRYLFNTYTDAGVPLRWVLVELQRLGSSLAGLARVPRGMRVQPSLAPAAPLELFSYESNPFARPVRELLCTMELSYVLRSVAPSRLVEWFPSHLRPKIDPAYTPDTRNRRFLMERCGRVLIPYLVDPNTGQEVSGCQEIAGHIKSTYAADDSANANSTGATPVR
ncbi:MAG: glutathione S-transferase N-terminal domain-containing protein [Proteobacteria bacterium]|nr:glutathione S-transferase N-terminal domain-containing protein [Pseudomonadota bacterium]